MSAHWCDEQVQLGKENISSAWALHNIAAALASRRKNSTDKIPVTELAFHFGHHIPISRVFEITNCPPQPISKTPSAALFDFFATVTKVSIKGIKKLFQDQKAVSEEIMLGLGKATNLQHLEICGNEAHSSNFFYTLKHITYSWPRLEHICFSGYISPDCILHLLRLNADSLREVELVDIAIDFDLGSNIIASRETLLENIRSTVMLNRVRILSLPDWEKVEGYLTYFAAQSGAKSEAHQAAEDYLARRIERLPSLDEWDFIRTAEHVSTSDESSELSFGSEGDESASMRLKRDGDGR